MGRDIRGTSRDNGRVVRDLRGTETDQIRDGVASVFVLGPGRETRHNLSDKLWMRAEAIGIARVLASGKMEPSLEALRQHWRAAWRRIDGCGRRSGRDASGLGKVR